MIAERVEKLCLGEDETTTRECPGAGDLEDTPPCIKWTTAGEPKNAACRGCDTCNGRYPGSSKELESRSAKYHDVLNQVDRLVRLHTAGQPWPDDIGSLEFEALIYWITLEKRIKYTLERNHQRRIEIIVDALFNQARGPRK